MGLSGWVMSIVGMVVLSVVGDIILPSGKISKTIKGVFAFITVLVIASPLPKFFNGDFEIFSSLVGNGEYSLDGNISQTIYDMRVKQAYSQVGTALETLGVFNTEITIVSENNDTFPLIEKIIINLDNAVINETEDNIITSERIRQVVAESASVDKEKVVVFYE